MAYVSPTPASIKAAYPEFAGVGDAVISDRIADAELKVDATWGEFQTMGAKLYTAHILQSEGHGSSSAAEVHGAGPGVVRLKAGDTEIELAKGGAGSASGAGYGATYYGRRFQALQRQLFGGGSFVRAGSGIGSPDAPFPEGYGVP